MASITPFFWIFGTLLAYFSLGMMFLLIIEACSYRGYKMLLASLAALLPAVFIATLTHFPLSLKFFYTVLVAAAALTLAYVAGPKRITDWKRIKQRKLYARHIAAHLVLATGAVVFITPFAWLVITSFKESTDIFKYPPTLIPKLQVRVKIDGKQRGLDTMELNGKTVRVVELEDLQDGSKKVAVFENGEKTGKEFVAANSALTKIVKVGLRWQNFPEALDYVPAETHKGALYLWNTIYITVLSIFGTLLSSSLVAYSFARLRWPGRDTLFALLIATMMIPPAVTMCPVFLVWRSLHCIDTLRPMWIPAFFAGAFNVFLLRQFFMTIPNELEDAAKIDGCSYFGIYWRIMLPLIKPALATLTIMTFMGSWNNFMGPLIYINSPEKMPLSYGLQVFSGSGGVEYGMLMAGSTMVMLPVLLIFFFTQRYFIQGITLTGIKG